eukprot:scaffold189466_cov14-Tisochrysis_lutea.AAC.1
MELKAIKFAGSSAPLYVPLTCLNMLPVRAAALPLQGATCIADLHGYCTPASAVPPSLLS